MFILGYQHPLHLPFNILTATVTASLGLSLSMPSASAITTWPKQPSPSGLPSVSLRESVGKRGYGRFGWANVDLGDSCTELQLSKCFYTTQFYHYPVKDYSERCVNQRAKWDPAATPTKANSIVVFTQFPDVKWAPCHRWQSIYLTLAKRNTENGKRDWELFQLFWGSVNALS